MPYYEDINTLFIHIPKTGGISLGNYLKTKSKQILNGLSTEFGYRKLLGQVTDVCMQHLTYRTIHMFRKGLGVSKDCRNICIVREPYDRMISYLFWRESIMKTSRPSEVYDVIKKRLIEGVTVSRDGTHLDNNILPQYEYVVNDDGELVHNITLFHTEHLTEELQAYGFKEYDGLPVAPHLYYYRNYLNADSISLLNDYYKKDFDMFGYDRLDPDMWEEQNSSMKVILIHIGKCSGSLIQYNLKRDYITYATVHHSGNRPPAPSPNPDSLLQKYPGYQFICGVRHPIDRWVSAFNFCYTRAVIQKTCDCRKDEIEGFRRYKTAQNMAENLYDSEGKPNARAQAFARAKSDHMPFGMNHYLKHFNRHHKMCIIRHEHIKTDFESRFEKPFRYPDKQLQYNEKRYDTISLQAYHNLKRFLKEEFDTIDRLYSYGWIDKEYRELCHGYPISTAIGPDVHLDRENMRHIIECEERRRNE